jgi:hypothetical protein
MDAALNPQPLPPRATTVYAPRDVLWDLDRFQKALKSILDQAGHPGCTSGLQLDWRHFEDYVINERLEAVPVIAERTAVRGR